MKSHIDEFASKRKPSDYNERLTEELTKLNAEFGAFRMIEPKPKSGFPFSVKDNICVKSVESTAASAILKGYIPPFSATAVDRLEKAGFAFIGKTNMDEFGFGTFGLNSDIAARNPIDPLRVAGGSSSGAAIATAVLKYHIALAESTGGSISAPASFCGVVGFTPTYGVVSRYGLIDYANSLDKIGLMARSAVDIEKTFDIIRGSDMHDSTSIDFEASSARPKRLVVINELIQNVDESVRIRFNELLDKFRTFGYDISYSSMPEIKYSIAAYYIISMAEASTNLARYTGFKYGFKVKDFSKPYNAFFTEARKNFGAEAKRRIVLGTFVRGTSVKSRYYDKALKIRRLLIDKLKKLLDGAFLISPTMPITTPTIEEAKRLSVVQTYGLDLLTIPPNLCGFPHISVPYDYLDGMPLGAQLIGGHFQDHGVLALAKFWEKNFEYKFQYNVGEL